LNETRPPSQFTFFFPPFYRSSPACCGSDIASMSSKSVQKNLTTQFMSITGVNEKLAQRVTFLPACCRASLKWKDQWLTFPSPAVAKGI
jgi:hypothetical protein